MVSLRRLSSPHIHLAPHPTPPLRLFEYSPQRLLDQVPTMFAFPRLGEVFAAIAAALPSVRTGAGQRLAARAA